MRVDVDEAGRHQLVLGVELFAPARVRAERSYGRDATALHGDIGFERLTTRAVDDCARANDQVVRVLRHVALRCSAVAAST